MEKIQLEIQSLDDLYNAYKNQIYTLCMRLTNSKTWADDLYGDTWTKVAEKYKNIKHNQNPMAWIYTVCINIYRKSATKHKKNTQNNVFSETDDLASIKNSDTNAEESLIKQEMELMLLKALSNLNDKYRLPLVLFYFRDLSYNDITKIMKISMSTLKFRLNYAKELLKKEMEVYK